MAVYDALLYPRVQIKTPISPHPWTILDYPINDLVHQESLVKLEA